MQPLLFLRALLCPHNRLPLIMYISGGLIVTIALLWHFSHRADANIPRYRAQQHAAVAPAGDVQTSPLAALALFSQLLAPQTAEAGYSPALMAVDDEHLFNAPRSTLDVRLTGIISALPAANSIVIVQHENQQYSLFTGDKLPATDAEIVRIFPDRAIVRRPGKYESLIIE